MESFLLIVVAPNLFLWLVAFVGIIYHSCRSSPPPREERDAEPAPPQEDFAGIFIIPSTVTPSQVRLESSVFVPQFTPFGTALPAKPRAYAVSETPRLSRSSAGSSSSGLFGTIPSARLVAILEALDEGAEEKDQRSCPHLDEVLALDMGFLEDSVFDSPEKSATERRPVVPPSSATPQLKLWGSVAKEVKQFHHNGSLRSARF